MKEEIDEIGLAEQFIDSKNLPITNNATRIFWAEMLSEYASFKDKQKIYLTKKGMVKLIMDTAIHFGVINIPKDDGTVLDKIQEYINLQLTNKQFNKQQFKRQQLIDFAEKIIYVINKGDGFDLEEIINEQFKNL